MMTKNSRPYGSERGVSPVVGVMLMLVVVIIIAAIVSGFSGNLMSGSSAKKAPTLSMDVKVVNTGYWQGSGFYATVTGVSEPIPTKDLKIVTSWKGRERYNGGSLWWDGKQNIGPSITGGSTVVPNGSSNINVLFTPVDQLSGLHAAPFGTGPGVNGTEGIDITRTLSAPGQQFGNYTLMQGTTLSAKPAGAKDAASLGSSGQSNAFGGYAVKNATYSYLVPEVITPDTYTYWLLSRSGKSWTKFANTPAAIAELMALNATGRIIKIVTVPGYTTPAYWTTGGGDGGKKYLYQSCGDSCVDPAKAVLGTTWYNLNWGDTVNVKVIHIPTGKVIFQQDVPVTEE